jgi:hypothetical protein
MNNITTLATAVREAFTTEHAAAANTDAAIRALFDGIRNTTGREALAGCKEAAKGLDTVQRFAHCLPSNASQVTGARWVSQYLLLEDDMGGMFDIRTTWEMACAVGNAAKHGGGVEALEHVYTYADTLSEAVALLAKEDAAVKRARAKADAAAKAKAKVTVDGESEGEGSEGEDAASVSTIASLLTAAVGTLAKAADLRMNGADATDEVRALVDVLAGHLSTIAAPSTVTVTGTKVAANA